MLYCPARIVPNQNYPVQAAAGLDPQLYGVLVGVLVGLLTLTLIYWWTSRKSLGRGICSKNLTLLICFNIN